MSFLLWPFLLIDAAAAGYLLVMTLVSLLPQPSRPKGRHAAPKYAIVIPAHDEEGLIGGTLESILDQDYPRDRYSVHLIADNCSDATAAIGRSYDVIVHQRFDPEHPGKGQALNWLLQRLSTDKTIDAYVFIDADSVIDRHFLSVMADHLGVSRSSVQQASYRVSNPTQSMLTSLRALAFGLMHDLRGRAKARLGLSAGLWGNGMVFSRDVFDAVPWSSFAAVEDAEQHIHLLLHGIRVRFVGETHVYGHMPATLAASTGQQKRWEGGRLYLVRNYWRDLAVRCLSKRDVAAGVALVELLLPPLSVLLAFSSAMAALTLLVGIESQVLLGASALAAVGCYIAVGTASARLPVRTYGALLYAPVYIAWKIGLFLSQVPNRAAPAWIRTTRD